MLLIAVHWHVRVDPLDDQPRGRLAQAKPARESVQPPHHVLDRGALVSGVGIAVLLSCLLIASKPNIAPFIEGLRPWLCD